MKYTLFSFLVVAHAALAQPAKSGAATISGTVVDAKTQRPVPDALVMAGRAGAAPFRRNTKSGADGAYAIEGLMPGDYLVCVQPIGNQYLNPCEWNGSPAGE